MRTKFDPNEIIDYGDYAEIVLYNQKNEEKARAIIDSSSIQLICDTKWYQRPDGYVATNSYRGGGYKYLHMVLLEKRGYGYTDHKDGNRLNNRMDNLRFATPSENGANKCIRSNNTSGRVGVHWSNWNKKWCAMIGFNKRHINLGYFDKFEDAVKCRESAEKKYFGRFRPSLDRVSLCTS